MRIVIASGKGGTGKTTITVHLALAAALDGRRVQVLDCDVEEPNSGLFLKAESIESEVVNVATPELADPAACTGCGACGDICRFNAVAPVGPGDVMLFSDLCHGCSACWWACPTGALREGRRRIGALERGRTPEGIDIVTGRLDVGQVQAPPLVDAVLATADPAADLTFCDAPPGAACPVVATLAGADRALLVCEPTRPSLHDMRQVAAVCRARGVPAAVVVNRALPGTLPLVEVVCRQEGLEILAVIPHDRAVAASCARGGLIWDAVPDLRALFTALLQDAQADWREAS